MTNKKILEVILCLATIVALVAGCTENGGGVGKIKVPTTAEQTETPSPTDAQTDTPNPTDTLPPPAPPTDTGEPTETPVTITTPPPEPPTPAVTKNWPENTPFPLPAYTSGTIASVETNNQGGEYRLAIDIDNSDFSELNAYLGDLYDLGWAFVGKKLDVSEARTMKNSQGEWLLKGNNDRDKNSVRITVEKLPPGYDWELQWPDFPFDIPAYTNHQPVWISLHLTYCLMHITGATRDTINKYKNDLLAAGWENDTSSAGREGFRKVAYDESWMKISITYNLDSGTIRFNIDWPTPADTYNWIENLPFPLPAYTKGTVANIDTNNQGGEYELTIDIEGTSGSELLEYGSALNETGWSFVNKRFDSYIEYTMKNDQGEWLITGYPDRDKNSVRISVVKLPPGYDWEVKWPELPINIPAFTDGPLVWLSIRDETRFSLYITGVTRAALDRYESKLIDAGWESSMSDYFRMKTDNKDWTISFSLKELTGRLSIIIY